MIECDRNCGLPAVWLVYASYDAPLYGGGHPMMARYPAPMGRACDAHLPALLAHDGGLSGTTGMWAITAATPEVEAYHVHEFTESGRTTNPDTVRPELDEPDDYSPVLVDDELAALFTAAGNAVAAAYELGFRHCAEADPVDEEGS